MASSDRLQQAIEDHDRRIEETERDISETRKTVIGVDKTMTAVLAKLEVMDQRWAWVVRLALAAICGAGAIMGNEFWKLITGHR